ncbi:MAG: type I restriction enzyme HsdR N-terminal domain-containing protein [Muribaculaceae bacterium]|nr:type I restriction enzyme HsdR N-terminal domain-containing protein [Muribaculaceae bacterium]
MELPTLNLPPVEAPVRPDRDSRRGGMEIFDPLRRRWVALTPEEWVRQHFTAFLACHRAFPAARMANEVALRLNGCVRRCDTVVYNRALRPLCIVEYKAPSVAVTGKVFDQIARYNSVLQAPYLIVSNGMSHFCCRFEGSAYTFLPDIPVWNEIEPF